MDFDNFFSWAGAVASVIAIVAALIGTFRFFTVRLLQARREEYNRYHQAVRQMNVDTKENDAPYLDMQVAAAFELTLMKRYYPVSLRILRNRLETLQKTEKHPLLCEEIVRSIERIEENRCRIFSFL